MGKGIDWKSPEAFTRLLAAIVAAQDLKLDYRKIASMYGQGATYDSIEGRFRIIKREAAIMRAEIEKGERPEAPPRGGGGSKSGLSASFSESAGDKASITRKPRTPKKAAKHEGGTRVLTGRVSKTTNTPQKPSNLVKEEAFEEESILDFEHEIQKDVEHDSFMETLNQVDYEAALQYQVGMEI